VTLFRTKELRSSRALAGLIADNDRTTARAFRGLRVRPRRKRNEDGEIPPMELISIWRSKMAPDVSKTAR